MLTNNRERPLRTNCGDCSRGELVTRYLTSACTGARMREILQRDYLRYGNFNFVFGSVFGEEAACFGSQDPHLLHTGQSFVVDNSSWHSQWPKTRTGFEMFEDAVGSAAGDEQELLRRLWLLLKDTRRYSLHLMPVNTIFTVEKEQMLSSIFIPPVRQVFPGVFGTVASTILVVDRSNRGRLLERRWDVKGRYTETDLAFTVSQR